MRATKPSIPSGGLLLDYIPPDPLEEGDDCAYDPHYVTPLADWHLEDMAKHRIVDVVAATLYVLGVRPKNAIPRTPPESRSSHALTKDDWFVRAEQVFLALDEAKRQGDALYKSGRLVRIHACPALVFITDGYYFPVLDLNTANPFAGMYHLVVGKGIGLPKTVGKLGKLLAAAERKQAKGQMFLNGVIAKEQVEFEGLSLDTAPKPSYLAYTRQHVKIRRTAGGVQLPVLSPAKVERKERTKWVVSGWGVSAEYVYRIACTEN